MDKAIFIIPIEIELPIDEEGLTDHGWSIAYALMEALDNLRYDYGWKEVQRIGNPRRKRKN